MPLCLELDSLFRMAPQRLASASLTLVRTLLCAGANIHPRSRLQKQWARQTAVVANPQVRTMGQRFSVKCWKMVCYLSDDKSIKSYKSVLHIIEFHFIPWPVLSVTHFKRAPGNLRYFWALAPLKILVFCAPNFDRLWYNLLLWQTIVCFRHYAKCFAWLLRFLLLTRCASFTRCGSQLSALSHLMILS